ncbi:MAG TPA: pentapeptide repeat-containing protein [Ktedonobacteraceae bacterium]|nr:pentapeptide repeat-containing protein [Ktedonobacteraceae bacterium]
MMIKLLIVGGIISFLTALLGVLLALRIQHRMLSEGLIERKAWEYAQGGHQLAWEARQHKHMSEVEQQLTGQVQRIQEEWKQWEVRFNDHSQKLSLEYTLDTLPKVEETPLALDGQHHFFHAPANWRPPTFYQADLRQRDFSHRFLGQVNFRDAQLAGANFYMADLRDACLAGANLAGANLVGTNLIDADLRGANLEETNLLVADLHRAILNGANLLHARNLTSQQLYDASYDHTTQLDPEIDITRKRMPATLTKNDDQPLAGAADLQADKAENTQTGALDTAIPRIGQNSTKRAMAG